MCAATSTSTRPAGFRVNANGKTIDVFQLLRSPGCGQAPKMARRRTVGRVRSISTQRCSAATTTTTQGWSPRFLLAAPLHQRNRLTVDWEGAWVLDADPIPGWPGRPVTVRVELVAAVHGDRAQARRRRPGDCRMPRRSGSGPTAGSGRQRAWTPAPAAAPPTRSTIRGPADVSRYGREPADGRNSWLEGAEVAVDRGHHRPVGRWRTGHHGRPSMWKDDLADVAGPDGGRRRRRQRHRRIAAAHDERKRRRRPGQNMFAIGAELQEQSLKTGGPDGDPDACRGDGTGCRNYPREPGGTQRRRWAWALWS